jgi:beta-glucanase (GH16 family)
MNLISRILFSLLFLSTCAKAQQLILFDDFNDTTLNKKIWKTHPPWGNIYAHGERDFFGPDSTIELNNNLLYMKLFPHIDCVDVLFGKPSKQKIEFITSSLFSIDTFGFGTFEIKCKVPFGTKPSLWLYGEGCEEIDVFEFIDPCNYSRTYMNIHKCTFKRKEKHHMKSKWKNGVDYSADFHTYTLIWTAEKAQWLIDGKIMRECNAKGDNACIKYKLFKSLYPKNGMHVIVTLASNDPKAPCQPTNGAIMLVDYIKVWKSVPEELKNK